MASTKADAGTQDTFSEMEWWERKDHPLLNHVILNTLFEFMRGKDLQKCRLVCKKWCQLTLPSARSKFRVKLNGNGEVITRRLTEFVEVFRENTMGIPFDKYILGPFCTTEGLGQEFLRIGGSTAKIVHLIGQEHNVLLQFTVEDISGLLKAMPNIELFYIAHRIHSRSGNTLKLFPDDSSQPTLNFLKQLTVYDTDSGEMSDNCPTFIEEILSIAPNISDFKVLDSTSDPDRSRIGQVLNAIENLKREPVIRNLRFICGNTTEHLESLRRLAQNGLKLKKLDFYPRGPYQKEDEVPINFLPALATLFKNTIERLCVVEICSSFIQLPVMPKLEKLRFHVFRDFDSKSVNLKKLFPALKKLDLYLWDNHSGEWEEFLPNSEPCPNVKTLSLGNIVMRLKMFDHILNIFPKLTKLELTVQTDGVPILRKVMTQMTQLENLSVCGTIQGVDSIDAFFTGIPVQKVQELEHVVTELKEMTVQLRADTIRQYKSRYCQFPSIANLTNLKSLHLSTTGTTGGGDEPTRTTRLTTVFAYFCLYSIKHINKLEIEDCEFTKNGCEMLTVEMRLNTWSFKNVHYRHIIPEAN